MSEHKLNLPEETRLKLREWWSKQKRHYKTTPGSYLIPGKSNIGRNKAKRLANERD